MTFAEEVSDLLPFLMRRACQITRNRLEAEDLVQETLLRAIEAEGQFCPGNLHGWLYTIMRNAFVNRRKQDAFRRSAEDRVGTSSSGVWRGQPPPAPDSSLCGSELKDALSSLSDAHLDVLEKVLLLDWKYDDYAKHIGRPIGTVMSRVNRARAAASGAIL